MEVPGVVPLRYELQSLISDELKHIGLNSKREVMIQEIEETLANAFGLGIQFTNTGVKIVFSRFLEKWG